MIKSLRRFLVVAVLAVGSLSAAAPVVLAATALSAPTDVGAAAPYVEVVPEAPEPDAPQWTYRFLIPAVVALTVVLIAGTVVMYFVKVVRGRYTVVE